MFSLLCILSIALSVRTMGTCSSRSSSRRTADICLVCGQRKMSAPYMGGGDRRDRQSTIWVLREGPCRGSEVPPSFLSEMKNSMAVSCAAHKCLYDALLRISGGPAG